MSISRTLFCGLEATNLAPTNPRSWCPASPRGLPPPGGNSALLTPTALPEDAASCAWVTAWASVPYPRPFPVLSLGLRPSLSPATQLSEPPPPGSWLRFHLWEPHTLLPSHVAVIMRREGKSRTNTRYIKQGHSYWDAKETTWNQLKPRWLEIVWSLTQNHSPLCLNSSKTNHKRSKSGQWPNSWKIPTIP